MDGRVQGDRFEEMRSSLGEAGPFAGSARPSPRELLNKKEQRRELLREDWFKVYDPSTLSDSVLTEVAAATMARIYECRTGEENARAAAIERAEIGWETLRSAEAAKLYKNLAQHPDVIKPQLEANLRATRWMVSQWQALLSRLERNRAWTEGQKKLALDLLGVPEVFRDGASPIDTPEGENPSARHLEVARAEVKRLSGLIATTLEPLDALERERMLDPYNPCQDRDVHRILRTERMLTRRVLTLVHKLNHLGKPKSMGESSHHASEIRPDTHPNQGNLRTRMDIPRTYSDIELLRGPEPVGNPTHDDRATSDGSAWIPTVHAEAWPQVHQPTPSADEPIAPPETAFLTPQMNAGNPETPEPIDSFDTVIIPSLDDMPELDVEDKSSEPLIPGGAPAWFCEGMLKKRDTTFDQMDQMIVQWKQQVYEQALAQGATPDDFKALQVSQDLASVVEQPAPPSLQDLWSAGLPRTGSFRSDHLPQASRPADRSPTPDPPPRR